MQTERSAAQGAADPLMQAIARVLREQQAERRAIYTRGWCWGVVCGLAMGLCITGTAVWLWHLATAALQCPTC